MEKDFLGLNSKDFGVVVKEEAVEGCKDSAMDIPTTDVEVKPETLEEVKEAGPLFHCDLFDTEIVHKIAQVFLPGLGSACVDNTTGGLFKNPASVAVDIRKEMVEYLTQRSETFVAEAVILNGGPEAEVSDHPYDITSDFVDDFASSKRNIFSRVSGWLLSERREDRIDDFVQEMEINGFWFMERREFIAQTLLKNVDFKNTFHCNMKFKSAEELAEHSLECSFRTMNCTNEGCNARFCASQLENHDLICPFKILPCEQNCSDRIMRREMDKHCITVCPMKLVNCPFYPVGCQSTIPHCTTDQHRLENLHSHLLFILQVIYKDAPVEDLKKRGKQIEESASPGKLAEARDVRSLTFAIKDLEAEIGPLNVNTSIKASEEHTQSPNKKEEYTQLPAEKEVCLESPSKKEEFKESPNKNEDNAESPAREECVESPLKKEDNAESSAREEDNAESSAREERNESPGKKEHIELPYEKEQCKESPTIKEEFVEPPTKKEDCSELSLENEENARSATEKEGCKESPNKKEQYKKSPYKEEEHTEFSNLMAPGAEEVDS